MSKNLLRTFVVVTLSATPVLAQECNDPDLEQEIKQMNDDGPSGKMGFHIIDFEDETWTHELPSNHEGRIILSCKANVLRNDSQWYHIVYDVEEHANGKIFTGYVISPGKYAVPPPRPATAQPTPTFIPAAPPSPAPATGTVNDPMYLQGQREMAAYISWHDSLTGEFQQGVDWWASHRSLKPQPTCETSGGSDDFLAGCRAAKRYLDPTDKLRLSNPIYRLGWNTPVSNQQ